MRPTSKLQTPQAQISPAETNFSNAVDYGGEVTQLIRKTEFYSKFCRRTCLRSLFARQPASRGTLAYDVAIK
jgi:hypothetical protein